MNEALSHALIGADSRQQINAQSLQQHAEQSKLSEADLNSFMTEYLKTNDKPSNNSSPAESQLVQTYSDISADLKERILAFKCIIGGGDCIYEDKNSLAKGKMSPKAKAKLTSKSVSTAKKPAQSKKKSVSAPAKKQLV